MTELYLIAHKVRGEPAFDVATQVECAECKGRSAQKHIDGPMFCAECDETGFWWIIPTSGHRAYPIEAYPMNAFYFGDADGPRVITHIGPIDDHPNWPSLPDHYTTRAAPKLDLTTILGIKPKPQPSVPIKRRF